MLKSVAAIVGGLILIVGVGLVVAHYVWWGSGTEAFVSLAVAAATLVVGWALLDWGAGITRRWRGGDGQEGPKSPWKGGKG